MSPVLHIFRKDARRLWPEIAVSLAVLAALLWTGPYEWRSASAALAGHSSQRIGLVRGIVAVPLLVVVSWGLLITRVVQAERLVGDTQFWLTRPYDWKRLLAAKALFLAVFLYLPLVVVQCVLLRLAGFHPGAQVGELACNLLMITALLVLPVFAIACVTANLARVALTLLGVFAFLVGISVLAFEWMPVNDPALPWSHWIQPGTFLVLCSIAIVLQYAARRARVARLVLLSAPLWIFAISQLAAYSVDRVYAQDGGNHAGMEFAYSPRPNEGFPASLRSSKEIIFGIPVSAVAVADGTVPVIENVRIAMEAADGSRWVSPWQGMWGVVTGQGGTVNVVMPREVYDRFRGKPLVFHLALAVAEGREQSSARVPLTPSGAAALGNGICTAVGAWSTAADSKSQTVHSQCRYAMRQPQLTHTALLWPDPSCSPNGKDGSESGGWSGTFSGSASFAIDPVLIGPGNGQETSFSGKREGLPAPCPASEMLFATYELAGRAQATVTIANFKLPAMTSDSGQ